MIVLPTTKPCKSSRGVATFDCSFSLPDVVGVSTISQVFLVGHFLGSSFRLDHKAFSLAEAKSLMDSSSVIFRAHFVLSKIF